MIEMNEKEFEIEDYVYEKLRLKERGLDNIEMLRRMYRDRDIGIGNYELFKVVKGKKWYSKSSRRK